MEYDEEGQLEVYDLARRQAYNDNVNCLLLLNINSPRKLVKEALNHANTYKENFCVVLHDYVGVDYQW